MSLFASITDVSTLGSLLELTVPSYGLRLVRRFGAERVGWFVTAAFASLAALHLLGTNGLAGANAGSPLAGAVYAFVILLLLIGMSHLDTVLSYCRRPFRGVAPGGRCDRVSPERLSVRTPVLPRRLRARIAGRAEEATRPAAEGCPHRFPRHHPSPDRFRPLAACVGQDLNNALAIIRGQARLLLEQPQDPASARQLRQLLAAADRAATFSRQLLVVGGRYLVQRQPVRLNAELENLGLTLKNLVGEGIRVKQSLAPDLPLILADVRLLEHVVLNLVLDARAALRGSGAIVFSTASVEVKTVASPSNPQSKPGYFVRLGIRALESPREQNPSARRMAAGPPVSTRASLRRASVDAAIAQLATWSETAEVEPGVREFRIYFTPVPREGEWGNGGME